MIRKIILVVGLFLPQKGFDFYYFIVLLFLLIDFIHRPRINKNYILIVFYFIALVLCRSLVFWGVDDLKELIKVLFFLFFLNHFQYRSHNELKFIRLTFLVFIVLNLCVVVNQIFHFDENVNTFVSNFFTAESQQILLTYNNVRAPGLSPGVGQQGVLFLLLSMFFWLLTTKEKNIINYLLLICSILILSQSKTAFIAFLIFVLIQVIYSNNKLKYLGFPIFIYILHMYVDKFLVLFKEYNDLVHSFWSSSLDSRLGNWINMLSLYIDYPFLFFIGIGRNLLTQNNLKSSVFDSDLIYVIFNFGFVGIIFFILFLVNLYFRMKEFSSIVIVGIVAGLTLNFFFEPKSFLLLLIMLKYINFINNEEKYLLDINKF